MSQQELLAYVGAISGVIGAIAGVAGAILAVLAFRRTGQLKALDLSLELRRTEATLQSEILGLVPLLEQAKASRTRLAAALGGYHSGATKHWLSQWETDFAEANVLTQNASALDANCTKFSQAQLEARLITIHKLQGQVSRLSGKYQDSLAADNTGREQLRADQRVVTQARLEGKL